MLRPVETAATPFAAVVPMSALGQRVPAVSRARALLALLVQEWALMTLARLDLPKSSVHALCHTLIGLGYLRRQGDAGFFLGRLLAPALPDAAAVVVNHRADA